MARLQWISYGITSVRPGFRAVFLVGQVDIHRPAEAFDSFHSLVTVGVMNNGQACLDDHRQVWSRGNEVDVVGAFSLESDKDTRQFIGGNLLPHGPLAIRV